MQRREVQRRYEAEHVLILMKSELPDLFVGIRHWDSDQNDLCPRVDDTLPVRAAVAHLAPMRGLEFGHAITVARTHCRG